MNNQSFTFEPIGFVRCTSRHRFEAPRQSVFAHNEGVIELKEHCNFETALSDLETVERIWVVFAFHLNRNWKPKIQPPVSPNGRKIGVFATRSPHRPNPLGISCVELSGIENLILHIRNFDLLDGTPVFDIKPYIPEADAFPDSKVGWLEEAKKDEWQVSYTEEALQRFAFLRDKTGLDMVNFCSVQLVLDPLNYHRKRVFPLGSNTCAIGCRAWKILFTADTAAKKILVTGLSSGYTAEQLAAAEDPYADKEIHREYNTVFSSLPWQGEGRF